MFKIYTPSQPFTKKALFLGRDTFGNILTSDVNVQDISDFNNVEIHLLVSSYLKDEGLIRGSFSSHLILHQNDELNRFYNEILHYIDEQEIKICIFFGSGFPWTKSFLEKVKLVSYTACYFADDPEGSEDTARYYVSNYDYSFCGGIYFDKDKKIEQKYLEWGAIKSKFIPLGACPSKYLADEPDYANKDIDLIYVGGAYLKKILPIFQLKKHFGERMHIYGRAWNYHGSNPVKKAVMWVVKWYYGIPEIDEINNEELIGLYRRTRIGFNMHLSYGPSNQRLYELPINGVMQICDCPTGLSELYNINEEVVAYTSIKEAIKKIEFYLKNETDRVSISKAGYDKTKKSYLLKHSFARIFSEIYSDLKNITRLSRVEGSF